MFRILLIFFILNLLIACASRSGVVREGLLQDFPSGIYLLESCKNKERIVGYLTKSPQTKVRPFCLADQAQEHAWAYLWAKSDGAYQICLKMEGYALEQDGVYEVGKRVAECHEIYTYKNT